MTAHRIFVCNADMLRRQNRAGGDSQRGQYFKRVASMPRQVALLSLTHRVPDYVLDQQSIRILRLHNHLAPATQITAAGIQIFGADKESGRKRSCNKGVLTSSLSGRKRSLNCSNKFNADSVDIISSI